MWSLEVCPELLKIAINYLEINFFFFPCWVSVGEGDPSLNSVRVYVQIIVLGKESLFPLSAALAIMFGTYPFFWCH